MGAHFNEADFLDRWIGSSGSLGWLVCPGISIEFVVLAVFTIWTGCIGFGFGSIFSEHRFGRRIIYWAATLGLIGSPPALAIPLPSIALRLGLGASVGAILGALFGTLQAWLIRRRLGKSDAGFAAN